MNTSFIKFISGGDAIELRLCHGNDMIKFAPKFITFFACNDIPETDEIDSAFSKRLRCIHFPTEFCVNPTKGNQRKINTDINKNFDSWRGDFMLLLIKHYKDYTKTKIIDIPDNVLEWTNKYKNDVDIYLQFLNENVVEKKAGDNKNEITKVHCVTLYESFKKWFKQNDPDSKIPSNKEFVRNLENHKEVKVIRIGNKSQKGLEGHILRNNIVKIV